MDLQWILVAPEAVDIKVGQGVVACEPLFDAHGIYPPWVTEPKMAWS